MKWRDYLNVQKLRERKMRKCDGQEKDNVMKENCQDTNVESSLIQYKRYLPADSFCQESTCSVGVSLDWYFPVGLTIHKASRPTSQSVQSVTKSTYDKQTDSLLLDLKNPPSQVPVSKNSIDLSESQASQFVCIPNTKHIMNDWASTRREVKPCDLNRNTLPTIDHMSADELPHYNSLPLTLSSLGIKASEAIMAQSSCSDPGLASRQDSWKGQADRRSRIRTNPWLPLPPQVSCLRTLGEHQDRLLHRPRLSRLFSEVENILREQSAEDSESDSCTGFSPHHEHNLPDDTHSSPDVMRGTLYAADNSDAFNHQAECTCISGNGEEACTASDIPTTSWSEWHSRDECTTRCSPQWDYHNIKPSAPNLHQNFDCNEGPSLSSPSDNSCIEQLSSHALNSKGQSSGICSRSLCSPSLHSDDANIEQLSSHALDCTCQSLGTHGSVGFLNARELIGASGFSCSELCCQTINDTCIRAESLPVTKTKSGKLNERMYQLCQSMVQLNEKIQLAKLESRYTCVSVK